MISNKFDMFVDMGEGFVERGIEYRRYDNSNSYIELMGTLFCVGEESCLSKSLQR